MLIVLIAFTTPAISQKRPMELEDIWASGATYPTVVGGFRNLNDGKSYVVTETDDNGNTLVVKYQYATGEKSGILIDGQKVANAIGLQGLRFSKYQLSKDESKALIGYDVTSIYRHSTRERYVVVDLNTYKTQSIHPEKVRYGTLSPAGTHVAYVFQNDLYIRNLEKGKTKRVTKDGEKNKVINGAVDWVYEEEFSMSKGYEWNSDGSYLAFYKFDESAVKQWNMKVYGELYPEQYKFKYPKAGEANSKVDVYLCRVKNGKTKHVELGSENDQYLPRIQWTKDPNRLMVQRLNRHQNHLELLLVNTDADVTKATEFKNKYYEDIIDHIYFLNDGKHMIIPSESSGYRHLYFHKVEGPQVFQITKGKYEVDEILGVDEKSGVVYYTSAEVDPTERHIYKSTFDGSEKKRLTQKPGTHTSSFSADFSFVIHTHHAADEPHRIVLKDANWKELRVLEDNSDFKSGLDSAFILSKTEFGVVNIPEGLPLKYWMIKPANFSDTAQYPLLMYVYGGPGSQTVKNGWGWNNYFWYQHLANKYGYIVVSVDNRGTGGRGEEFKKMTYQQLGKYETQDQIAAAKYFASLNYIDEDRVGIWGWSYGGYMSSLCLTKGADVFKTAIAVAPVTNWRYYDNIYTERYMRTPQENPDGYDDNSPINHIEKLKGNYLIIHGTGDDNVHFQNTAEMVKAMISKNIPFDSEFYPNKNHGIYGGYTRLHLYNRMTQYLLDNL